jgi:Tfp pilus assembly protein PilF
MDFTTRLLSLASLSLLVSCATLDSPKPTKLTSAQKAEIMVQAAFAAVQEGDPTGALQALVQAEELSPKSPNVHHVKAIAYFTKKLMPQAIASAKRAVELDPKFSDGHNTLGRILLETGDSKGAEAALLKSANDPLYRDAFKSRINLGILNYNLGKFPSARTYFDSAIQESPTGACIAYYYRGNLLIKQNRVNEAIKDYDQATKKLCTHFTDAHLALGIAYQRNGQNDKAKRKFLSISELFPDTPAADQAMNLLKDIP